ncbi:MAG: decarboxylating NADP(+)-dependent phosphogluconate dehydrogenase [Spirochaetota bacterium]
MVKRADIGLIGLAVMGQNLVLNMSDHGYHVSVYNRTGSKTEAFLEGPAAGRSTINGYYSLEELISSLQRPRKVMLMVKAGTVVDTYIEKLLPLLESGDVIIDGGNSLYRDTQRRTDMLESHGLLFIGTGISGGEEGARLGPSIMPGGSPQAWPLVKPLFQDIAAKTDDGQACCDWVGEKGAGHYVKMVHNGIEYGDIQLIGEAYHLLKDGLRLDYERMQAVFAEWNTGELDSYLIEITANILGKKDEDGQPLVEHILDTAGQKGTGKWTGISSFELGVPVTLIGEAVYSRCLSAMKDERTAAAKQYRFENGSDDEGSAQQQDALLEDVRLALLASKIVSYAQGFMLMREAAAEYNWNLNYGGIALMWREGCIIRSAFLENIRDAFDKDPNLKNLLLDDYFQQVLERAEEAWRRVVKFALDKKIPVPALSSALAFFDGYRSRRLPANLLQAQRDYFGAHTYERTDRPRGEFFHTDWTGSGGDVSSGTYDV